MPGVHRKNDVTTGHSCWPPTNPATWSPNFFINERNVVINGNQIVSHCCPGVGCHDGIYIGQSGNFFVNNCVIQVKGDPVSCGDFVDTVSENFFCF